MKKLIVVLFAMFSALSIQTANAGPFVGVGTAVAAGTSAGPAGVLVGALIGGMITANYDKPVPYNLTDACKAQTVKAAGGNYSFTSYEHCLSK